MAQKPLDKGGTNLSMDDAPPILTKHLSNSDLSSFVVVENKLPTSSNSLYTRSNKKLNGKSPTYSKIKKSASLCDYKTTATPISIRKLSNSDNCDNISKNSTNSDDEVEYRHKNPDNKSEGKKSRSSLKSLRNSFRNSFRINRSSSYQEPQERPKVKPRRSKTVRIMTTALLFAPIIKMQPVAPAPLLIEDPPNNDDVPPDLEEHIKHLGDPALLNGSSGNFGSAGARSAPSTPHGAFTNSNSSLGVGSGQPGGLVINTLGAGANNSELYSGGGALSQPCTPGCTSPSIQRSPSHSVFTKCDKTNLKNLSTSTPQMTAQGQPTEPPSPKTSKEAKVRTTSKSHQKKFRRHFQNVNDEEVLNHYVCALIGDILLQGHLYITNNYFAFYSNVFGYVTKLLIPVLSVEKITKEKTARIIPNAVGIKTFEDKHIFGSLMSRDATLQYMMDVWQKAQIACSAKPLPVDIPDIDQDNEIDSTESGESGRDSPIDEDPPTFKKCESPPIHQPEPEIVYERRSSQGITKTLQQAISEFSKLPRQSLILFATTLLLILLFLSAGILLYRISKIQNRYSLALQDSRAAGGEDIYNNLLQWQSHLHTKSAGAVNNFLDSNLDQIAKVRQSLEALSTLLMSNSSPLRKPEEGSSSTTSEQTTGES